MHLHGAPETLTHLAAATLSGIKLALPRRLELGPLQMTSPFELSFPCFIVRRDDESRFAVVQLPDGNHAIAVLTDPNLVQMFLFERCFDRIHHHPLPINTPTGLARILTKHLPPEVTHVVFNPNGIQPRIESVEQLVKLLKSHRVVVDVIDF
jgi:hypothetical protein